MRWNFETKPAALNEELEAFTASASHDLRAPLRHIQDFAEVLRKEIASQLNTKGEHYVQVIAQSARQMGVLIDELLAFARVGRAQVQRGKIDTASLLQAVIETGASRKDGEFVFCVRDNGVGFEPQYASKLFGVFQRLQRPEEFEGTGIGLANVRRVIQKHGGRTWAEGAPSADATFHFTIPVSFSVN
ncbi:MAG: ATP-binding protein [Verrucomicrobiota bacterium]|nr:ATP-binding protein [Verrucomicrobiota bacterium]